MVLPMSMAEGFKNGIDALNRTIVSDEQIMSIAGRAYIYDGEVFANRLYIRSVNEVMDAHAECQNELRLNKTFRGRVYAGTAGLLNLGYISAIQPRAALIYDLNIYQVQFWNDIICALAQCKNSREFKAFLLSYMNDAPVRLNSIFNNQATFCRNMNPKTLFHQVQTKAKLIYWLLGEMNYSVPPDLSWAGENYDYLHEMAGKGAIAALTLNVNDASSCAQLGEYLGSIGQKVDVLYTSNIFRILERGHDYTGRALPPDGAEQARQNLQKFTTKSPRIIDSWPVPHGMG